MFDFGQAPRQIPVPTLDVEPTSPFPAHRTQSGSRCPQPSTSWPIAKGLTKGWLIERASRGKEGGGTDGSLRRYLQIGTGQWCGAEFATLFPLRRTAITYAREFGLLVEQEAQIVHYEHGFAGS